MTISKKLADRAFKDVKKLLQPLHVKLGELILVTSKKVEPKHVKAINSTFLQHGLKEEHLEWMEGTTLRVANDIEQVTASSNFSRERPETFRISGRFEKMSESTSF